MHSPWITPTHGTYPHATVSPQSRRHVAKHGTRNWSNRPFPTTLQPRRQARARTAQRLASKMGYGCRSRAKKNPNPDTNIDSELARKSTLPHSARKLGTWITSWPSLAARAMALWAKLDQHFQPSTTTERCRCTPASKVPCHTTTLATPNASH